MTDRIHGAAKARDWEPVLREDDYLPRACTGYVDHGLLLHDGDTCPLHESGPTLDGTGENIA